MYPYINNYTIKVAFIFWPMYFQMLSIAAAVTSVAMATAAQLTHLEDTFMMSVCEKQCVDHLFLCKCVLYDLTHP